MLEEDSISHAWWALLSPHHINRGPGFGVSCFLLYGCWQWSSSEGCHKNTHAILISCLTVIWASFPFSHYLFSRRNWLERTRWLWERKKMRGNENLNKSNNEKSLEIPLIVRAFQVYWEQDYSQCHKQSWTTLFSQLKASLIIQILTM